MNLAEPAGKAANMMSRWAIAFGVLAVVMVGNAALPSLHGAESRWKTYREKPDEWYRGREGTRVVANVLSYQSLDFSDRKRPMFSCLLLAVGPEFRDYGLHIALGNLMGRREHGDRLAAFGDRKGFTLLHLAEQPG